MSKVTLEGMRAALEHYFQPQNLTFTTETFEYYGTRQRLSLDKSLITELIQQQGPGCKLFYAQKIRMTGFIVPNDPTIPSYRMDDVTRYAQIELVDNRNETLQTIYCYKLEHLPEFFKECFPKRKSSKNHDIKQELQRIKELIDKVIEALTEIS